jgi:hypothetical protein
MYKIVCVYVDMFRINSGITGSISKILSLLGSAVLRE